MATELTRGPANAAIATHGTARSLRLLAISLADTRISRDPALTQKRILNCCDGDELQARAVLAEINRGPATATPAQFAGELARLGVHYYRPEFGPGEIRSMVLDFIADLAGATLADLQEACAEYRRNPKNRFFPTPGQLLEPIKDRLTDRKRAQAGAALAIEELDREDEDDAVRPSYGSPAEIIAKYRAAENIA